MKGLDITKLELHSKPNIGKTMLGLLKTYGTNLHQAHLLLIHELKLLPNNKIKSNWTSECLLFQYSENNNRVIENEKYSLIASSLLMNWICGRILNQISIHADLFVAELWFNKSLEKDCISNNICSKTHVTIMKLLSKIDIHLMIEAIPYLAEVFETGNETADEKGAKRKKKKNNGVYYTPTDVIDFIVSRSIYNRKVSSNSIEDLKWYDPAVGTGGFLLSVLRHYSLNNVLAENETLISYVKLNLFGTDISPHALQSASYIIATNCLVKKNDKDLKTVAKTIGTNLALIDATTINNNQKLQKLFPAIGNNGVDFIISNPPYSKKQQDQLSLFDEENISEVNSSEELYPDFIKILLDLPNKQNGGGCMVVPLSLVASTKGKFNTLRSYITSKNGSIEFWNFDRTPDSLFGDDVKTRNTIFFFTYSNRLEKDIKISSTFLHRWNSRNRDNLFNSISLSTLEKGFDITKGVPKVGDKFGVNILHTISNDNYGKLSELLKTSQNKTDLITKTTAYNWLPIEINNNENLSKYPGQVNWEIKSDIHTAPIIYALLNSRLTYWLWRVWSDGFHLTNKFIHNLPFGVDVLNNIDCQKMDRLGQRLWSNIQTQLIVTKNAGIISNSYCPLKFIEILDEIDLMLIDFYCLPNSTVDYLKSNISKVIMAGRENESQTLIKMKYLEPIN